MRAEGRLGKYHMTLLLQRCTSLPAASAGVWIKTKALQRERQTPDGNSSHVKAVVSSSGPAAKHLKQAQSRRALHAGTQCAAGAQLRSCGRNAANINISGKEEGEGEKGALSQGL